MAKEGAALGHGWAKSKGPPRRCLRPDGPLYVTYAMRGYREPLGKSTTPTVFRMMTMSSSRDMFLM
jgi:hypothetical protein